MSTTVPKVGDTIRIVRYYHGLGARRSLFEGLLVKVDSVRPNGFSGITSDGEPITLIPAFGDRWESVG